VVHGARAKMIKFGGQEVKGQGHMRQKIDLELGRGVILCLFIRLSPKLVQQNAIFSKTKQSRAVDFIDDL